MSDREGKTYSATLRAGRRSKKIVLRRVLRLLGIAFTVLDCHTCGHRVCLEAHHQYASGKPRRLPATSPRRGGRLSSSRDWKRYKAWRTKMLRTDLRCPVCKGDAWRYVRTDVYDHGPACKLYSEVTA